MRKIILVFLLVISLRSALSQPATPQLDNLSTPEKVEKLKPFVRELVKARDFEGLLKWTATGLSLSSSNNEYISFFTYYRGHAFHTLKQIDSAILNMKMSIAYSKKAGDLKRAANAMQQLHYIYYYAGRGAERVPMMNEALGILDTTTNLGAKSTLISILSEYYFDQGQFEKAITYKLRFIEAEKKREQPPSATTLANIGIVYLQVAETYSSLNQPGKALQYLDEARPYVRDAYTTESTLFNNFIRTFLAMKLPDSAAIYYKKIYGLMKAGDSLYENLSFANRSFADFYITQKNFPVALNYAQKAFLLSQKSSELISIYGSNQTLGTVLYHLGKYEQALEHFKIASRDSASFGSAPFSTTQLYMAKSYAALQNWEKAYLYYDDYNTIRDSIIAASDKKNINETEAKFQNKDKQQQIENKNLQLTVARKQRLWLISGLALLLVVAVLLIAFYRNKKRTADLLDEKNKTLAGLNTALEEANRTKAKLFSIISHDLRSPISQVYQFLKLQQLNPQLLNEQQRNELSNKIQSATGSLLETMEDLLLWSKTQMSEFKPTIRPVGLLPVVEACQNLLQLNSESKNIRFDNTIDANIGIDTDAYYLQTIVRNLLQNAVKASPENATILIGTELGMGKLILFIENQGGLFTQEQFKQIISSEEAAKSLNGLGLRLADELSQKIGATITFKSPGTTLTRVEIMLP